ncbi:glycosyltransferase family 2 protein [Vibrio mexicanus]|uniref:glycosyltransferase family 2 protein n=1 Tax=Vibrio mexicanus TaxID=1004326 RepID=UPI00069BDDB5|nr:glycosyltransferase family 2 protein [Vibrio mexicanus]
MNNKPLVSTVVPNYNNAEFIEECVQSILSQDYENIEVIIADDCSTDHSKDVIEKLAAQDKRVKVVFNQENLGITKNRMIGIEAATGEYFNYLDSDDFIPRTDKLSKEMELITYFKQKLGEDVIAFSDVNICHGDGRHANKFRLIRPVKEGWIHDDLVCRRCLVPQNFTMKKELYTNVGGHDDSIPFYENWDLKIRLAAKYRYVYTGIDGFSYRRHGHGLSNQNVDRHRHWVKHIIDKNLFSVEEERRELVKKSAYTMVNNIEDELDFINQHIETYAP